MTDQLTEKLEAAIAAIAEVHQDGSGPPQDNLKAIRELLMVVNEKREVLEIDCGEGGAS